MPSKGRGATRCPTRRGEREALVAEQTCRLGTFGTRFQARVDLRYGTPVEGWRRGWEIPSRKVQWSVIGYECRPVGVQCCSDADCGAVPQYKCANGTCERMFLGCGWPFLVKEEARVARAIIREDFAYPLASAVSGLTPVARAILARHWTEVALLEHASVAAFARFVLDLLALGAPADLVAEAQRAGADEIEHARLAFGMAAAFRGAPVGPGPLPVAGALDHRDRAAIVVCTFREGCVGETLAAVEAAAARDASRDPVVGGVLARIAEDELRHATLAYRFVAWALRTAARDERAQLVAILRAEHRKLVDGNPSRAADVEDQTLIDGGLLPDHTRRDLAMRAQREVVTPCFEALLESAASSAYDVHANNDCAREDVMQRTPAGMDDGEERVAEETEKYDETQDRQDRGMRGPSRFGPTDRHDTSSNNEG